MVPWITEEFIPFADRESFTAIGWQPDTLIQWAAGFLPLIESPYGTHAFGQELDGLFDQAHEALYEMLLGDGGDHGEPPSSPEYIRLVDHHITPLMEIVGRSIERIAMICDYYGAPERCNFPAHAYIQEVEIKQNVGMLLCFDFDL